MVTFSPDLSHLTRFAHVLSHAGGSLSQSLGRVDVRSQTDTSLSIVTAEGDKVTLTTNASFQGVGVNYNARGIAEGQTLSLRSDSIGGSRSSYKQISIEGTLNEHEIQDIKKIVNTVNALRREMVSGQLGDTLTRAQQISSPRSIDRVDLNIQHAESVSIRRQTIRQDFVSSSQSPTPLNINESVDSNHRTPSKLEILEKVLSNRDGEDQSKNVDPNSKDLFYPRNGNSRIFPAKNSKTLFPRFFEEVEAMSNKSGQAIERLSQSILKGAEKIAALAGKLHRAVQNTTTRIEKDTQKISDLLGDDQVEEANALQQRTDRRINRLGKTTERLSSRIAKTAERLDAVATSLNERLNEFIPQKSQPSSHGPDEPTETIPPVKTSPNHKTAGDS